MNRNVQGSPIDPNVSLGKEPLAANSSTVTQYCPYPTGPGGLTFKLTGPLHIKPTALCNSLHDSDSDTKTNSTQGLKFSVGKDSVSLEVPFDLYIALLVILSIVLIIG